MAKNKTSKTRTKQSKEDAELAELTQQRERREQTIIGVIVVIILAIIVTIGGYFLYQHATAGGQVAADSKAAEERLKVMDAPKNATKQGSFIVSKNGYNKPVTGKPTIGVYLEPLCLGCATTERTLGDTFQSLVENGQANLELHFMTFQDNKSSDQYSSRVANGMTYIAEHDQNPQHLLKFIQNIYAEDFQPKELSDYKSVTNEQLAEQAVNAGVDKETASEAFNGSLKYKDWLKTSDKYAIGRSELYPEGSDSFSTPTITIDGKRWNDEYTVAGLLQKIGVPAAEATPAK